jgi:ribosome biogenesis GTPase / thiamine phosphate phosphatase
MDGLAAWGWTPSWEATWNEVARPGFVRARVILEHGRFLRVHDGSAETLAVPAGRLRHEAESSAELPTVGDWVALAPATEAGARGEALASIQKVLPRRSRFSRRRAGVRAVEQVVAANIDTVFLLMGLDADFNPRRLERYLAVAFTSGARPVIVLNKADLATDLAARQAEVAELCGRGQAPPPILVTNLADPAGHAPIMPFLCRGETVALLGSSGVGKSTLLNRLMGAEIQRTNDVRAHDGRGRHTTTYAQLFALPNGALVIDTPGMRELQLWEADAGLQTAFPDVDALAAACRFRDCRHEREPGCAVQRALAAGTLDPVRFASFRKLGDELAETHADPRGRRPRRL